MKNQLPFTLVFIVPLLLFGGLVFIASSKLKIKSPEEQISQLSNLSSSTPTPTATEPLAAASPTVNNSILGTASANTNSNTTQLNPLTMTTPPPMTIDPNRKYTAALKTSAGDITIELSAKQTPITVNNFVFLAKNNFYTNTIFHRVIKGFMIQGGDPKGDGTGGPGYTVTETPSANTQYLRGEVAMAKKSFEPAGTQGSQFFIMHQDYALPPDYVVFGHVTSGLEVVDAIANSPVDNASGQSPRPLSPTKVTSVQVIED